MHESNKRLLSRPKFLPRFQLGRNLASGNIAGLVFCESHRFEPFWPKFSVQPRPMLMGRFIFSQVVDFFPERYFFARIKHRRRISPRYEKLSETFPAFVTFATVLDRLHFEV